MKRGAERESGEWFHLLDAHAANDSSSAHDVGRSKIVTSWCWHFSFGGDIVARFNLEKTKKIEQKSTFAGNFGAKFAFFLSLSGRNYIEFFRLIKLIYVFTKEERKPPFKKDFIRLRS